jgi:hypothetical protein
LPPVGYIVELVNVQGQRVEIPTSPTGQISISELTKVYGISAAAAAAASSSSSSTPLVITICTKASPNIPLAKIENPGALTGTRVDLNKMPGVNVNALQTNISRQDEKLAYGVISGVCNSGPGFTQCEFQRDLGSDGSVTIVLPVGSVVSNIVASSCDEEGKRIEVKKITSIRVSAPNPGQRSQVVSVSDGNSNFHLGDRVGNAIVVLGDTSGSMGDGMRMSRLKASYMAPISRWSATPWLQFAFASWNNSTSWCSGSSKWLFSGEKDMATRWVSGLVANGGTDMNQAIAAALQLKSPPPSDIFVMCDGNFQWQGNWMEFRKRHPAVTFHFVALGKDASPQMQEMAGIGGGGYQEMLGD